MMETYGSNRLIILTWFILADKWNGNVRRVVQALSPDGIYYIKMLVRNENKY